MWASDESIHVFGNFLVDLWSPAPESLVLFCDPVNGEGEDNRRMMDATRRRNSGRSDSANNPPNILGLMPVNHSTRTGRFSWPRYGSRIKGAG